MTIHHVAEDDGSVDLAEVTESLLRDAAEELARDIGVPVEEIDYQVAGVNHVAFYLKFRHRDGRCAECCLSRG